VFQRDSILLSLSPSGIRVGTIVDGQVAKVERISLDPDDYDAHWKQQLRPLDDLLRKALATIDAPAGSSVLVSYHGPLAVAEVFNAPAQGKAAMQAADMYLRQSLPGDGKGWHTERWPLREEEAVRGEGTTDQTTDRSVARTLVLTVADTNVELDVLAAWVVRCGLVLKGAIPTRAAMLHQAVSRAPADPNAGVVIRLFLSEHAMTISGWIGKHLAIARCADAGYALLIDAVHRSGRGQNLPEAFNREYATRLLFSAGMPVRGQMMDMSLQLKCESVLPLIQPALQRLVIEVRQTLRFGLAEGAANDASIMLCGPGSGIPGLAEMLSEQLELSIDRERASDEHTVGGVAEDQIGDLSMLLALRAESTWMVPPLMRSRAIGNRMGMAMQAGAGVGVATLALFAGSVFLGNRSVHAQMKSLESAANRLEDVQKKRTENTVKSFELNNAARVVNASVGKRVDWAAALLILSQVQSDGLEITEMTGSFTSGKAPGARGSQTNSIEPVILISGRAIARVQRADPSKVTSEKPVDPIMQAVEQIKSHNEIIESVQVQRIRVTGEENGTIREFGLAITLRGYATDIPKAPRTKPTSLTQVPETPAP
jgi:hypothetical protein